MKIDNTLPTFVLCILFLFAFILIDNKISKLEENLNSLIEEQTITDAIIKSHINNTLSKDYGGE